jgi:hypothetical protein
MKVRIIMTAILLAMGANAAYALGERDVTTDGDATITEEQKLGPNVMTYQGSNSRITTRTGGNYSPWFAPPRGAFQRSWR